MQSYMHGGYTCDFSYTAIGSKLSAAIQGSCFEFIMDWSLNTFREVKSESNVRNISKELEKLIENILMLQAK